jgi:hypothetical protein
VTLSVGIIIGGKKVIGLKFHLIKSVRKKQDVIFLFTLFYLCKSTRQAYDFKRDLKEREKVFLKGLPARWNLIVIYPSPVLKLVFCMAGRIGCRRA